MAAVPREVLLKLGIGQLQLVSRDDVLRFLHAVAHLQREQWR